MKQLEVWAEDKRGLLVSSLKEEIVLAFIYLSIIGLSHKVFEDKNG